VSQFETLTFVPHRHKLRPFGIKADLRACAFLHARLIQLLEMIRQWEGQASSATKLSHVSSRCTHSEVVYLYIVTAYQLAV